MTYTIDESRTAKNFTANADVPIPFGGPRTIESITIHHWGVFGQNGPDILNWFCDPNTTAQTSAHFVVWDGNIYCIVSPWDAAWAAGSAEGNRTSIHIECHPEATAGDYATVAWLVSWLRGEYGDLPLHPHNFWVSTTCPGIWDLAHLDSLARGQAPAPTPQEPDVALTQADADLVVTTLLNRDLPRQGGPTGLLNLAAYLQWSDSNFIAIQNLVKQAIADGAVTRDYAHTLVTAAVAQIIAGQAGIKVDPAAIQSAVDAAFANAPAPTFDSAALAKAVNDEADARERTRLS